VTNGFKAVSQKPAEVTFSQILLYLAAAVNLINGIYSIGNESPAKKVLSFAMIIFGAAAVWAAARLGRPDPSRLKQALILAWILIVLRIVEFFIWYNLGFLLGIILPVLVIWRLTRAEVQNWFRLSR